MRKKWGAEGPCCRAAMGGQINTANSRMVAWTSGLFMGGSEYMKGLRNSGREKKENVAFAGDGYSQWMSE